MRNSMTNKCALLRLKLSKQKRKQSSYITMFSERLPIERKLSTDEIVRKRLCVHQQLQRVNQEEEVCAQFCLGPRVLLSNAARCSFHILDDFTSIYYCSASIYTSPHNTDSIHLTLTLESKWIFTHSDPLTDDTRLTTTTRCVTHLRSQIPLPLLIQRSTSS